MLPYGRLIGFFVTAVVSILLLILPVYSNGQTLFNVNGNIVFGVLAIPVVIALTPLAFDRLKITAAIAMSAFVIPLALWLHFVPTVQQNGTRPAMLGARHRHTAGRHKGN